MKTKPSVNTELPEAYDFESTSRSYDHYYLEYEIQGDYDKNLHLRGNIRCIDVQGSTRDPKKGDEDGLVSILYITKVDKKIHTNKHVRLPKDLLAKFESLPKHIKSLLKEAGLVSKL